MSTITIKNNSEIKILFSDFNFGGGGIPFDATWINSGSSGTLKTGNFTTLGVGAQVQNGGVWLVDPIKSPRIAPGDTYEFDITFTEKVSQSNSVEKDSY